MTVDGDSQYIDWKNWSGRFGQQSPADTAYFERELRGTVLTSQSTVLEIGFGAGAFLGFCQSRNIDVTGTELNKKLVEEALKHGFKAFPADGFEAMDAGLYDLIVAFDVLEHIPKQDIPGFLRTLRHLLKDDGRILLRFPNGDSWLGRINQNGDPTHVSEIGYLMLDYFTRETGLVIEQFRAPRSPGFAAGPVRGLHALIGRPLARTIGFFQKAIYFPGSRIVLSASNVVTVLKKATAEK